MCNRGLLERIRKGGILRELIRDGVLEKGTKVKGLFRENSIREEEIIEGGGGFLKGE